MKENNLNISYHTLVASQMNLSGFIEPLCIILLKFSAKAYKVLYH